MEYILLLLAAFLSTFIGRLSGCGGGIIFKPVIDALMSFTAAQTSFLSSITVFFMSLYSFISTILSKSKIKELLHDMPLIAIGSALGGYIGGAFFITLYSSIHGTFVQILQSFMIFIMMTIILIIEKYFNKNSSCKIEESHNKKILFLFMCGLVPGILAGFLGIGGGPVNMALLMLVLRYDPKKAVIGSLMIILVSQSVHICYTLVTHMPDIKTPEILICCIAGIAGGVAGSKIFKILRPEAIKKLYISVILLVMVLCVISIFKNAYI